MTAYSPHDPVVVLLVVLSGVISLVIGPPASRITSPSLARVVAWSWGGTSTSYVIWLTRTEPAGVRMITLVATLLLAMKIIVLVQTRVSLTARQWIAFAAGWLGMRPAIFRSMGAPSRKGVTRLLRSGALGISTGLVLFTAARLALVSIPFHLDQLRLCMVTLLLLPALSLIVHFGLLDLAAAAWQSNGVAAEPLFCNPLRSTSLTEFWSRRWNVAFSEMTSVAIYRPLDQRFGTGPALFASFLFSGVLHELAISVPAQGGYGLPFLYFAMHGGLVAFERRENRNGAINEAPPSSHRLRTLAALILPLPLLFHPPFLRAVVWPLVGLTPL